MDTFGKESKEVLDAIREKDFFIPTIRVVPDLVQFGAIRGRTAVLTVVPGGSDEAN